MSHSAEVLRNEKGADLALKIEPSRLPNGELSQEIMGRLHDEEPTMEQLEMLFNDVESCFGERQRVRDEKTDERLK